MFKHHEETIKNVADKLKKDHEVLAMLVSGSIAHGFAREDSDVDIMIVVSEENLAIRSQNGQKTYFERESCTYEGGYIDGKYISLNFIKKVAEMGSEPARFAFEGVMIAFSNIDGLQELLNSVVRYPTEAKTDRIERFYAQLQAWRWYCDEALKKGNAYLLNFAVSNLILFAGRLILAHNETLYPYHKWFLQVLEDVPSKPENLMENIQNTLKEPVAEHIEALFRCVVDFRDWNASSLNWPVLFMNDSELNWLDGKTPIADI